MMRLGEMSFSASRETATEIREANHDRHRGGRCGWRDKSAIVAGAAE
jgi:hypothetical protein